MLRGSELYFDLSVFMVDDRLDANVPRDQFEGIIPPAFMIAIGMSKILSPFDVGQGTEEVGARRKNMPGMQYATPL